MYVYTQKPLSYTTLSPLLDKNQLIGQVGIVFSNGPRDWNSIPYQRLKK